MTKATVIPIPIRERLKSAIGGPGRAAIRKQNVSCCFGQPKLSFPAQQGLDTLR